MADDLKSDHYTNRRKSLYNQLLWALPDRIRLSWFGRRYWDWVHSDTARIFHCPPENECAYCEDCVDQPLPDRVQYAIERVLP